MEALKPTYVLLTEYISIPAVTATYGFALTSMGTPFSAILFLMRVWLAFIYPASELGCGPAPRRESMPNDPY
jgi:hypothetical protein